MEAELKKLGKLVSGIEKNVKQGSDLSHIEYNISTIFPKLVERA